MVENRSLYQAIANPVRVERVLMVQQNAEVIGTSERASRGQRRLLNEVVPCVVAVKGPSQEPLRARRLVPVKPGSKQPVSEWNRDQGGDVDRTDPGDQTRRRKPGQGVKLIEAELAVRDARVLVYILE